MRVGKVERSFPEVAPLLKLRLGLGWALGLFRRRRRRGGVAVQGECYSRGCRDKVDRWEPAALRIQPGRKLGVKRDTAGGAVGLDVKLERGRKAQGCAAAYMLESQLCFVFASNPSPLPERKTVKCGPQVSSVVLKMYLCVLMGRAGRKKNRCT